MTYSTKEITKTKQHWRVRKISKKNPKVSRRFIKRAVRTIVVIGLFWYVNHGGFFFVSSVHIMHDNNISTQRINQLICTSDLIGVNAFVIPSSGIARTLRKHPEIEDIRISRWSPGKLKIRVKSEKTASVMFKPWGYYALNEAGQFIKTLPLDADVKTPIKFLNENLLFDDTGRPLRVPWEKHLHSNPGDRELMIALGYRDTLRVRELLEVEHGLPEVQYIGYDNDYGLILKCHRKPLILLGYGNDLIIHFDWARKVLLDPELPFKQDKYIDLRFESFHSAKNINNLPPLFKY